MTMLLSIINCLFLFQVVDEENSLNNSADDYEESAPICDVSRNVNGYDKEAVSRVLQKFFTRNNPLFVKSTRSCKV